MPFKMDMLNQFSGVIALAALILGIIAIVVAVLTKKRADGDLVTLEGTTISLGGLTVSGSTTLGGLTTTGSTTLSGLTTTGSTTLGALDVNGNVSIDGTVNVTHDVNATNVRGSQDVKAGVGLMSDDLLVVNKNATIKGDLAVYKDLTVDGSYPHKK